MPELCQEIRDFAPELVRGGALDGARKEHVALCPVCSQVIAGAAALGRDLAMFDAPEPPLDLVKRTLARVRLSEAAASSEAPVAVPQRRHRRSTVELLETWALPGPAPQVATPREGVLLRLVIQAAAAVVIFACCTFFTLEFYPAYVEALEEQHVKGCQEHLGHIEAAIARYHKEHPEAANKEDPLQGLALRDALVRGGYAHEEDFVCPSVRGARVGELDYFLRLPDAHGHAVAWDHFGNHGGNALNVVRASGRPELLEGGRLWAWMSEGRQ